MADEDTDITVKVEDAEQKTPDAGAEQSPDPVAELQAQYDELQTQQKRDQEAREAAEARARAAEAARAQAEQAEKTARTEATDTRLGSIDQSIESAKAAGDAAQSEYTAAVEAGDWKKAGEAQRRMARAESDLGRYEQNKAAWESYQKQPPQPQRQQPAGDPVDNYINQVAQSTPNSANWLRSHRDWVTDPKKNAKLTAAHWDAVGEGIAVDTPEYFAHVEGRIGLNQKPESKVETKAEPKGNGADKAPPRRQSAPVAPVTPSPGGTSGGAAEVRLTRNEAAAATDGTLVYNYDDPSGQKKFKKGDPIGIQEMARRKKIMQEQGLYDRNAIEA